MVSFPPVSLPRTFTPPSPHPRHMPSPSHSSRFYHPHNIGWGVQIIYLLVMQSSYIILCFKRFDFSHAPVQNAEWQACAVFYPCVNFKESCRPLLLYCTFFTCSARPSVHPSCWVSALLGLFNRLLQSPMRSDYNLIYYTRHLEEIKLNYIVKIRQVDNSSRKRVAVNLL